MLPDALPLPGQRSLFSSEETPRPSAHPAVYDTSGAVFSSDGRFRYELRRGWRLTPQPAERRILLAAMLNPSKADALQNDPTVRRLLGFAKRWGFSELRVVNLFARVTSSPRELEGMRLAGEDVVGPCNDEHIFRAAWAASQILVGWGAHGDKVPERVDQVLELLGQSPSVRWANTPIACLGTTISGQPRHPLYLKKEEDLVPFERLP